MNCLNYCLSPICDDVWEKAEVLYTFRVLPEIEKVPKLRWIQSYLAGMDSLIENPLLNDENISVTSMSGANTLQVAEHAVALLLALLRQIPLMDKLKHDKKWPENKGSIFSPQELHDSTVGIVGYGAIGREVARLLKAFGANIVASKANLKKIAFDGYIMDGLGDPEGELFTRLYPPQALQSMFAECDHVIITTPLTPDTKGSIGKKQLEALKKHSYLINVSRGAVIDEQALLAALLDGKLFGAGLDVFVDEPLPEDHAFYEIPNMIISPHVAGFSAHYRDRAFDLFIANLEKYIAGDGLYNLYDQKRGY
jgi:phosphoglycerate dehydrogenase-like enzyme